MSTIDKVLTKSTPTKNINGHNIHSKLTHYLLIYFYVTDF